jgi:hypothetical protein
MNIYAHRRDPDNPGDFWSSPGVWLNAQLPGQIFDYKKLADIQGLTVDNLIIGGGGFGGKFIKCIEVFVSNNLIGNIIVWGTAWEQGRSDLEQFSSRCRLVGMREWINHDAEHVHWVPCASVLHSRLPRLAKHQPVKDVLIVDHWKRKSIKIEMSHTRMTNYKSSMDQVVSAIADHNIVLTSSYHVVYWSILLRRRVVFVSQPWLPKVDHMRWSVPCAETFSWQLLDLACTYPDAYDQALQANLDFLCRVQSLSDLPVQDDVVTHTVNDPSSPTQAEIDGS